MNKNSKQNRDALAKNKCDTVCIRMRTMPNSSSLSKQTFTLSYGKQKQLNSRGKVGNCKGKAGKSEVEEIFSEPTFTK